MLQPYFCNYVTLALEKQQRKKTMRARKRPPDTEKLVPLSHCLIYSPEYV